MPEENDIALIKQKKTINVIVNMDFPRTFSLMMDYYGRFE